MDRQASVILDLLRSRRFVFTAIITKMFSNTTKGQIIASTATLMMNTKRSSRKVLVRIGLEENGPVSQLTDVALIVV